MAGVRVDQDMCCGSGLCSDTLPDVFDQRIEDGLVELLNDRPDATLDEQLRFVAFRCPSRAITVLDE